MKWLLALIIAAVFIPCMFMDLFRTASEYALRFQVAESFPLANQRPGEIMPALERERAALPDHYRCVARKQPRDAGAAR